MINSTTSNVVIVGGGTAGWLTGLFVKRRWPDANVSIIENPKKPPIIAGESGSTTFVTLLKLLKIDFQDFVKKVNATPKLGGKFVDWNGIGTEFHHVLQTDYAPWLEGWTSYVDKQHEAFTISSVNAIMMAERAKDSYLKTIIANDIPLAKAFYANYLIEENKVPLGFKTELPCEPMWHFESRGGAAFFKELGLSRGINLVEGEFQTAIQDISGDITSILLDGDRHVNGDWFFDCSGFARLLLGETYKEPIVDYTNYFPARAVVAWWDEPCPCVTTNATAMKYGWSWNINIRNRAGNGYIYDPDHITLDQAIEEATIRFNKPITPIANFQFTPGMMRKAWRNNTIAIGLSSGFLEPLEANGVAVIVESLFAIDDYWDPSVKKVDSKIIERFNDRIWLATEDIRDFLALHYRGQRRDTEFWKSHAYDDFRIPESLSNKLKEWEDFYYRGKPEPWVGGYSAVAWLMVLQGLEVFDSSTLKAQHAHLLDTGMQVINSSAIRYKSLIKPFDSIEQWIVKTA